ncbi:hypothetical protein LQF12_04365 [Ruania suaedae]|uniref:hypothetical protein n=1 Tax=Ruania suaedae TaxID=2897774 RepID=UPI001E556FAC|nr:hypothetical protein [Ruania suaedae]UFU03848.1 hypothetical protein LQF12_04365 [Ruania suaedae]
MAPDDPSAAPPRRRVRGTVILATVVFAVSMTAIWGLAVPFGNPCPAVYPPPPGCTVADRTATGVPWTIAITAIYVACIVLALKLSRRRRWLTFMAIAALGVVAIVGYGAVRGFLG